MGSTRKHRSTVLALAIAFAATATSCVDLEPKVPPVVRWLTIDDVGDDSRTEMAPPRSPRLALDRVETSDAITGQLVTRISPFEVSYAEFSRWVEPPEKSVERALEQELFRRRGFERTVDVQARRLHVELVAFELSLQPRREAVVAIIVHAIAPAIDATVIDQRIEARAPIDGDDPALVARGISVALESVVTELSDLLAVR